MEYAFALPPSCSKSLFVKILVILAAIAVADNMLIYAKSVEEHDRILLSVITSAKKLNVKFNPKKCQFRLSNVKYLFQIDDYRI